MNQNKIIKKAFKKFGGILNNASKEQIKAALEKAKADNIKKGTSKEQFTKARKIFEDMLDKNKGNN